MNWKNRLRETAARCALGLTLISTVMSTPQISLAQSAPAERPQLTLTRTAETPLTLRDELSRNLFRSEVQQVPYQEQVPYQDTETYTIDVPYQDTETYTEQVPYTVSEPYTDTETYYEREQICRDVTRTERECRNERTCHTEPTTERQCSIERICRTDRTGQQVCMDKEVCRQVGGGRQVCHDNPVCRDVPRSERRCEWTNVPRTRTVTRYRDVTRYRTETRTRTVTRYRSETRTRQVTRYRTETRCCRPETVQVFDRQLKVAVQLNFPAQAQLLAGEKETIRLALSGTEETPQVDVQVESSIFKYQVVNPRASRGSFTADLQIVPAYTPEQLGKGSVMNLKLMPARNVTGQQVVFVDKGVRPRVETRYQLTVVEALTGAVAHQAQVVSTGAQQVGIDVPAQLSKTLDYILRLEVARSGLNLSAPVQFTEEVRHDYRRFTPEEVGPKTVSKLVVVDTGAKFLARFQDLGTNENIETIYRVSVMNLKTQQPVHQADHNALEVTSGQGAVTIEIPREAIDPTADHKVTIRIGRQGVVLSAPVVFAIDTTIDTKGALQAYRDESRVILAGLQNKDEWTNLILQDNTPLVDGVKTSYDIEIKLPNGKSLGRALLPRADYANSSVTDLALPLRRVVNSRDDLLTYAQPGMSLELVVRVSREGAKLGKVAFTRKATLKVP